MLEQVGGLDNAKEIAGERGTMTGMSPDDSYDPFTRLDGVHLLVVDDNLDARTIYKQILVYAGASVLVVGSATAAVRSLRHVRPDVVISDLSMPRRDGLWLIDWISSIARSTSTGLRPAMTSSRNSSSGSMASALASSRRFKSGIVSSAAWR